MSRTSRTILIMALGPPALMFALVYLGATRAPAGLYGGCVASWALGMTALAFSGWQRKALIWVGAFYTLASILLVPLFGLMAACSMGDCL